MNLKKTLVSAATAFVIMGSMLVPTAANDSTTTGTVQVADAGVFSVSICDASVGVDFSTVSATTNTSGTGSASLSVCYEDTKLHRLAFTTMLYADEWTSSNIPAVLPQTTIAASNLIPSRVWSPIAVQLTPNYFNGGYIYGDYGSWVVNPVTVANAGSAYSETWTGGSLDTARQIGHGDQGRGTTYTTAQVDLTLTVPANTSPGTYTSTITLDVTGPAAP